jgi:hypothetical protein
MKTTAKKSEEPPSDTDLDAWRRIAAEDGLRHMLLEKIVVAIQRPSLARTVQLSAILSL